MRRPILALTALVLAAGCTQDRGTVYQVPPAQARQVLMATDLPPFVFGTETPPHEVRADGPSEIVWIVRRGDVEVFRYVAHLAEARDGATRVKVELKGAEGGPAGDVAQKLKDKPAIRTLYLTAMRERVASALEGRPFQMSRLYPAMTVATAENMGAIRASVDQAATDSERMERKNIEKAYREEAAGLR